jgi:hypothetical protein
MLEPNEVTRTLARQRVTIVDYPDGRIAIRHKGRGGSPHIQGQLTAGGGILSTLTAAASWNTA